MIYPIVILAIENDEDRLFMQRLYEDYHQIMYREARRILHGDDAADDMVNDACLSLIGHIETLRSLDICKTRAYVVSTIKHACFNYIKKRNRQNKYAFLDAEDTLMKMQSEEPPVDERLIRDTEIEELMAALRMLPEKEMYLLEMKYFSQMPDDEIALVLGIKTASVRYYLTLARRRAFEIIAKERTICAQ